MLFTAGLVVSAGDVVTQQYDKSFQTTFALTPDAGGDDDLGFAMEIGSAITTYKNSDLGVFLGHIDADKSDLTMLGAYVRDYYDWGKSWDPMLGVKFGYAWSEAPGRSDQDSLLVGFGAGVRVPLNEKFEANALVEFLWSNETVFLEDDQLQDKAHFFSFGVTYRY